MTSVTVQKPTVTRTQLGNSGTDWPRQQTFKRWDIRWWSSKGSVPCQQLVAY